MADIKHLEYCVKLGNKLAENKLMQMEQGNYVENNNNNYNTDQNDTLSFKQRLQNWK